jgi:hypothetical protein
MGMVKLPDFQNGAWKNRFSRSSYFFGAILLHLIVFFMVATWVIFPAFHPPADDFTKTYLPPSSPPPPPPPPAPEAMTVPTQLSSAPSTPITSNNSAPTFTMPLPDIVQAKTQVELQQKITPKTMPKADVISSERLARIMETEKSWGRDKNNILESNGDPKNVVAAFPVYLASYADGDWGCNVKLDLQGNILSGSLPNLVGKINEWSKGKIKAQIVPKPLSIGGPELLDKKPPFIFFTGHKDFKLTDQEIKNLQDYLQIGGAIWGDNALPGRGSRFDVAFRREMKRVIPDLDKNFEPVPTTSDIFAKSWFPLTDVPAGMNFYSEPLEHLDIDGKLAILYSPNDYSDMFSMHILPGDFAVGSIWPDLKTGSPLVTNGTFWDNKTIFFRNFTLPSCLGCQQLGMNILGYMLVRFDKDMLLSL